ncbi:MAG: DUF58 domain-containing protein [Anaerolineae bacterium]|nr:DUF58 domain-containing protein [Anaerolineae bacterium]
MSAPVQPTTKIRLKNRYLPALVIFLIAQQFLIPYRGWVYLIVGLGGAWLMSYLWARSLQDGLRLTRETRMAWAQVGDEIQEEFTLINQGWAPGLWVTVLDKSNFPGYSVSTARYVEEKTVKRWLKGDVCRLRGMYTFGPTSLQTSDPFGLYEITIEYPASTTMLVVPPIVPLPTIEVATGERIVEGHTRSNSPGRTVSAATVREYVPGDDIQSIHWRTSAKLDKLYVRVFDSTPSSEWWIFVDTEDVQQAGADENSTIEHSVILAASLADRGLRLGRAVGLAANGNKDAILTPRTGNLQQWEMLRTLAMLKETRTTLGELLFRSQRMMNPRTSAVIITPAVGGEWLNALNGLLAKNIVITVLLLDRSTYGGNGQIDETLGRLNDLGIRHHLINSQTVQHPRVQGNIVWRDASSSRFPLHELDWSRMK